MKDRYKTYLKLNLVSIFFIAVSFISISLAWFAYSGLVRTKTEIDVKAWHIEFDKNGTPVTNSFTIFVDGVQLQPGMTPTYEKINIKNLGDSDAKISYKIDEARILNEKLSIPFEFGSVEDKLANYYPFSINISIDKKYLEAKTGEATLNVGITWPLDSDTNQKDSDWGNLAYEFQKNNPDSPSIKIVITVKVEQNTDKYKYNSGDMLLYDVINNTKCDKVENSCIRTHILNTNVSEGNDLLLLPDLYDEYPTGTFDSYSTLIENNWSVLKEDLKLENILNFISQDIDNTYLIRENLSDRIVGYIEYNNRFEEYLNNIVKPKRYNSYFKYDDTKYNFLSSNKCYWINTEYDELKAFALVKDPEKGSIITPYEKSNTCSAVPIIKLSKEILNYQG